MPNQQFASPFPSPEDENTPLAHLIGTVVPAFGGINIVPILIQFHCMLFPGLCQTRLHVLKHADPSLLAASVMQRGLTVSYWHRLLSVDLSAFHRSTVAQGFQQGPVL